MTRGNIAIIDNSKIFESMQFNGDMYLECHGTEALELLLLTNTSNDFVDMLYIFDEKNFNYIDYGCEIYNEIKPNPLQIYFDFSQDYFRNFNSDYIYIKNISNINKTIIDINRQKIEIKPNEIMVFCYGRKIEFSEFLEMAQKNIDTNNTMFLKEIDCEENNDDETSLGDKIRNMTNEELAIFLSGQENGFRYEQMLKKLKSPM